MDNGKSAESFIDARLRMASEQLVPRDIRDERVLVAMRKVERHLFVGEGARDRAYEDSALPIGSTDDSAQTISQPYIVALMTEALRLSGRERVLEVGSGCGYQTAILAELSAEVFSVECVPWLAYEAERRLFELGYRNVRFKVGDGSLGWPEHAPYDAILVAAAPRVVPPELLNELSDGGRLVIPVGTDNQMLELHVREEGRYRVEALGAVRFVPLIEP